MRWVPTTSAATCSAACCTGRGSLGVGFAATTLSVVVSLLIGGAAGRGGKLGLAVQRLGRAELGHDAEPRGAAVDGDGAAAGDVAGGGADPVVYCLNMVGDALRDLLDPRLRGGGSLAGGVGPRRQVAVLQNWHSGAGTRVQPPHGPTLP